MKPDHRGISEHTIPQELANEKLLRALAFAVNRHGDVRQARRGTAFPYVIHPLRVAEILYAHQAGDDVVVAGLLHDVTEDAGVTQAELAEQFGLSVSELVADASEPDKSMPWRARKEHSIQHVRTTATSGGLLVIAADKLDNLRSIRNTLTEKGADATWSRFNAGRSSQEWYYRSIADALVERDHRNDLFQSVQLEVDKVFPPAGWSTRFFYAAELCAPEGVRPFLANPKRQWRRKYSAYELATSWLGARGIPPSVRQVLDRCDVYKGCELVEGLFERDVDLRTPGRRSQTDLLALVRLQSQGYGVIAVEGKVSESFGPIVSEWNTNDGKKRRLERLCEDLGITPETVTPLRYQLLHRSASALYEAERYGAREALMAVHSFDPHHASLDDYQRFASVVGCDGADLNAVTTPVELKGHDLRLAWIADEPST